MSYRSIQKLAVLRLKWIGQGLEAIKTISQIPELDQLTPSLKMAFGDRFVQEEGLCPRQFRMGSYNPEYSFLKITIRKPAEVVPQSHFFKASLRVDNYHHNEGLVRTVSYKHGITERALPLDEAIDCFRAQVNEHLAQTGQPPLP